MTQFPELLVHIGAGKTGSTSIQFTLRQSHEALAAKGLAYLGLTLEEAAAAQGRDWSVQGSPQAFFQAKDGKRADEEMIATALTELKDLAAKGVTRAIWSNEAYLTRGPRMLPVMRRLAEAGVRIVPVCYVRRHDEWARSGYVQFGIKYKSYPGPLRNFADWVAGHDLAYAPSLAAWGADFPNLEIYNYDAIDNVALHFLDRVGIPELPIVRANERPSNALLSAWAVFNGRLDSRVLPQAFQKFAARLKVLAPRGEPVPPLSELVPTAAQLAEVRQSYAADMAQVNALLQAQGQPPMEQSDLAAPDANVSPWEMDRMMLTMIFSLQRQVTELEEELARLKAGQPPDQT